MIAFLETAQILLPGAGLSSPSKQYCVVSYPGMTGKTGEGRQSLDLVTGASLKEKLNASRITGV